MFWHMWHVASLKVTLASSSPTINILLPSGPKWHPTLFGHRYISFTYKITIFFLYFRDYISCSNKNWHQDHHHYPIPMMPPPSTTCLYHVSAQMSLNDTSNVFFGLQGIFYYILFSFFVHLLTCHVTTCHHESHPPLAMALPSIHQLSTVYPPASQVMNCFDSVDPKSLASVYVPFSHTIGTPTSWTKPQCKHS